MRMRVAYIWLACCLMGSAFGQAPQRWVYTQKLLEVDQLPLRAGTPTNFVFKFHPSDSVKVHCRECLPAMEQGDLHLQLSMTGGTQKIGRNRLDTWLPVASTSGKIAFVLKADKNVTLPGLEISRKSDSSRARPGPLPTPLEVKNLFIPENAAENPQFMIQLTRNRPLVLKITSAGASPEAVRCKWYREGETFDFDLAPLNTPFTLPKTAPFRARYIFDFSTREGEKNRLYNVKLELQ